MFYPKTKQQTYSISRYLKALRSGSNISEFYLGGRLQQLLGDQILLSGQGEFVSLQLQGEWPGHLEPGDDIAVKCDKTETSLLASEPILLVKGRRLGLGQKNPWTEAWSKFQAQVRELLLERGLQEVETPSLVQNPGMEPQLKSFETSWSFGSRIKKLFLATSPELHLKQLLSAGWTDIFEIKKCFRSEELSNEHEPEFTMLEWYRGFSDLEIIQQDLKALISRFDPKVEFEHFTVDSLMPDQPVKDFHLHWVENVEPNLPKDKAVFISGYPAEQAALARLTDDGKADRFELYWKGFEIANAFHELNDPEEQRRRHLADQKYRTENGLQEYELDENFLAGLEAGMPPSGGIALGLDRLFMALYDVPNIQAMRLFSITHQLRGEL